MAKDKQEPKGGFASAAEKAAWIRGDKKETPKKKK